VHTAGKNLSPGIRFKQVILKGFLRLNLQPVQLISPTSITDKKIHQPSSSNDIIRVLLRARFPQLLFTAHLINFEQLIN
jgi:hypothetical protein